MMELIAYQASYKQIWDDIINQADNAHFMFYRDYMEYHADRFEDASYMLAYHDKIIGVIAGNITDNCWYSHQGLTFGGLFMQAKKNRIDIYMQAYHALWAELKNLNIKYAFVKPIPFIYHRNPCESDLYALGQANIVEHYIEVSTSVNLYQQQRHISNLRIRGEKKAKKNNLLVQESNDYKEFWRILSHRLDDKYHAKPVHNLNEIIKLQKLFPDNIKLYVVINDMGSVLAGTVLFVTDVVYHVQYITATDEGMQLGALDLLFFDLIDMAQKQQKSFFDFGISTEKNGVILNEKLASFKEGFGGGSIMHHKIKVKLI